ncbi:MAG: hypothetical protein NMK33_04400 [Candidatus Cardinium sp.]|uniref:hypothetical protein n=1 Tax=Cardinium endosymbiont of Dermatophagoides farinae TaxID=2597823 RepID=UPI001192DE5B|nr:hypothetical protein [Cardinium endosymbiont of Dermatophagoides farinae]TSJ80677.1 hypothetical protein FPG78_01165 [Cardinium endosymbiont of Dermatophagoides farinae]UWW96669.1 MAG: hypothetical protein NMK33_04400 [Candidatus Cardinium sp.]
MNNDYLDVEAVSLVTSDANKAHKSASSANQKMHNIAPISITPCLKKGDARENRNPDKAIANLTKIQAKIDKNFPNAPRKKQKLFSMIAIAGATHNIWTHAAKLVLCAIGIHIALNQPHCVVGNDMLKLATDILENTIVIQNKNELEDLLKYKLKHPTPTIDELPDNNITDTLDFILKSAHAAIEKIDTINKIDANYLEDDVFFHCNTTDNTRDSLVSLYNQAFIAFTEANNTNQAFQNAWNPIMNLTHCPLAALQQPFDATIKARDAAKNASDAYCALVNYFVDYFSQLTSVIKTMLNSCTAWFRPTIQKTLRSCDQCVNVTQAKQLGNKTVPLGVDLKAVQEVVDKLNKAIKKSYKDVQENCNSVNNAIEEAHKTAELYTTCYNQYNNIADTMHIVFIAPQPDQTNKTA